MQTQRLLILTIAVLLLAEAASAQTVSPQPVDDAPAGAGSPPHSQDIPVKIAKWSEAKDGLRIGLHIVSGDWSVGGKVRAEVWLHNAGRKDLTFLTSSPNRQGSGVAMSAIGADRREIRAEFINELISERLRHCTLPAGPTQEPQTLLSPRPRTPMMPASPKFSTPAKLLTGIQSALKARHPKKQPNR